MWVPAAAGAIEGFLGGLLARAGRTTLACLTLPIPEP